jgi:predicted RNA-binding Zn-ribbon protein involved in translation (DUF1610 family)
MKYRHRGYRDTEYKDERARPRSAPPAKREVPDEQRFQIRSMRHAMDREAHEVLRCHSCGRGVTDLGTITSSSTCPHCPAALHCCRNCRHFDSAARWQCRAPIAAQIADKIGANDCDKFEPRLVLDATGRRNVRPSANGNGGTSTDPRSQFESLFKR